MAAQEVSVTVKANEESIKEALQAWARRKFQKKSPGEVRIKVVAGAAGQNTVSAEIDMIDKPDKSE